MHETEVGSGSSSANERARRANGGGGRSQLASAWRDSLVTGASAVKPAREGFSVLAAASGSLISFGKALALELSPVRVNVLLSGVVDTPIHSERRAQMRLGGDGAAGAALRTTRRLGERDRAP
jgi:hypothetical protein